MITFSTLWLPILLSTVFVFLLSWMIHMLPLWHKSDYPRLANEEAVRAALRPLALMPGDYMIPRPANHAEMRSPEFTAKMNEGPIVMMTVMPNGPMSMGKSLGQWFVYCAVISSLAACIAGCALPAGTDPHRIFHITALTAFSGYSFALWEMSIWYKRAWSMTLKATMDGLVYALATGITFAWLWPK